MSAILLPILLQRQLGGSRQSQMNGVRRSQTAASNSEGCDNPPTERSFTSPLQSLKVVFGSAWSHNRLEMRRGDIKDRAGSFFFVPFDDNIMKIDRKFFDG